MDNQKSQQVLTVQDQFGRRVADLIFDNDAIQRMLNATTENIYHSERFTASFHEMFPALTWCIPYVKLPRR